MPTENRSSNTEKALTFTESSLAAALEKVQSLHDLGCGLIAEAVFQQRAEQHQGEPVAYEACGVLFKTLMGAKNYAGSMPITFLYTHPAPIVQQGEPVAWLTGDCVREQARLRAEGYRVGNYWLVSPVLDAGSAIKDWVPVYTHPAPAVQQGEPVAWMTRCIKGPGKGSVEEADGPNGVNNLEFWSSAFPVYEHADPGEVERLRGIIRMHAKTVQEQADQLGHMRVQLAEADTLLCRAYRVAPPELGRDIQAALSASAEPSACEHDWVDARNEHVLSGELCTKCHAIRAGNVSSEPSAPEQQFVVSDSIKLCAPGAGLNQRVLKVLKEVESFYGDGRRDATEYLQLRYELENAGAVTSYENLRLYVAPGESIPIEGSITITAAPERKP